LVLLPNIINLVLNPGKEGYEVWSTYHF